MVARRLFLSFADPLGKPQGRLVTQPISTQVRVASALLVKSMAGEIIDTSASSLIPSWEQGWADIALTPDPATRRSLAWSPIDSAICIADISQTESAAPSPFCSRSVLRRAYSDPYFDEIDVRVGAEMRSSSAAPTIPRLDHLSALVLLVNWISKKSSLTSWNATLRPKVSRVNSILIKLSSPSDRWNHCKQLVNGLSHFARLCWPSPTAYRRGRDYADAGSVAGWGNDNRSTAIRYVSCEPARTRLELRTPGVDASPYLSIASALASLSEFASHQIAPLPATSGNAYEQGSERLSTSWSALARRRLVSPRVSCRAAPRATATRPIARPHEVAGVGCVIRRH